MNLIKENQHVGSSSPCGYFHLHSLSTLRLSTPMLHRYTGHKGEEYRQIKFEIKFTLTEPQCGMWYEHRMPENIQKSCSI